MSSNHDKKVAREKCTFLVENTLSQVLHVIFAKIAKQAKTTQIWARLLIQLWKILKATGA